MKKSSVLETQLKSHERIILCFPIVNMAEACLLG